MATVDQMGHWAGTLAAGGVMEGGNYPGRTGYVAIVDATRDAKDGFGMNFQKHKLPCCQIFSQVLPGVWTLGWN